ncbi:hypothetical protein DBV15_08566 [Temnothorax longispinosus]|uniref:Uncharacterized protein n=1 Tax=Temnothorax longispinosus TaxID=300112 RepID=A0A4S2L034_9HYME|nr:hypothetical protein DBV15_08566 [Temnothorax longispinosus]
MAELNNEHPIAQQFLNHDSSATRKKRPKVIVGVEQTADSEVANPIEMVGIQPHTLICDEQRELRLLNRPLRPDATPECPPFDQLATTSHMLLLRAANSEGSPLRPAQ